MDILKPYISLCRNFTFLKVQFSILCWDIRWLSLGSTPAWLGLVEDHILTLYTCIGRNKYG